MIVLQGLWHESELLIWGETNDHRSAKLVDLSNPKTQTHPFALPAPALQKIVKDYYYSDKQVLGLPSTAHGPIASPQFGESTDPPEALHPWRVNTVCLVSPDVITFLERLSEFETQLPDDVVLGDSLRFFGTVAAFALELRVRGRVLPAIEATTHSQQSLWRPVILGDDIARVQALANSMPVACRSVWRETTTATETLKDMLNLFIDSGTRHLSDLESVYGMGWIDGLADRDEWVSLSANALPVDRSGELNAWKAEISNISQNLRLCFRIMPPDDRDAEDPEALWQLQLAMQSLDDPSLVVECADIWKQKKFPGQKANPIETLLRDLGRAVRLCYSIDPLLEQSQPHVMDLSIGQAARFLQNDAPVLEGAGFGVFVPSWWGTKRSRLTARLKVTSSKQPPGESSGLLTKDGIITYDWQVAIGDEVMSGAELSRLAKMKQPLVRMRGMWVSLNEADVAAALAVAEGNQNKREMTATDALRIGLGIEAPDIGIPVQSIEATGWVGDLLKSDNKVDSLGDPAGFDGTLRPYQQRGLSWLDFHNRLGVGACLADDMGLGKTAQLIALLMHERSVAPVGPTLIVCPMSVVGNWQRELTRFAPKLTVYVHHGDKRVTKAKFAEHCINHDVVLTTYQLAARDQKLAVDVDWHRIVLDEAQNIKNPEAAQTKAIRTLPAAHRVALTGTPVENRLSELWSIMEFLNPGLLGNQTEFRHDFARPIERNNDEEAADRLRRLTAPFVLRRLKTDRTIISDLPEKLEIKTYCNLTREQATLYQAVVDDMLDQIGNAEGIQRKGLVLAVMTKLKQICNHPAQFLSDGSALEDRSGKLQRLDETIDEIVADGERVLVFTQYAEMGTLLKQHLQRNLGTEVAWLHGGTTKTNRDKMVERFQSGEGPSVFLLSLKAGGTGLNLTAANHVVHFDRWWNPAVENQATDRAYRIGQNRNVQVRKFVTVGTLEERIDQMIEQKQALADRIVGSSENWITELSTEALREIIELGHDAVGEG